MSYLDIIVTAAVVALVLFAAHRAGQANPVGTGKLARRMDALELKVAEQGTRMEGLEKSVLTIAATIGDLSEATRDVERSMQASRIEAAGDRGLAERTWATVARLQDFFIEDSFKSRRNEQ